VNGLLALTLPALTGEGKRITRWGQCLTLAVVIAVFGLSSFVLNVGISHAQTDTTTGSICTLTFNDLAKNGIHAAGDPILSGVNVTLAVDNGLMIANHLSDDQGQYCFTNLTPGRYRLTFSDPLAQPTTPTILTLTVNAGDQLINLFGAVPDVVPDKAVTAPATANQGLVITLTRSGRLVLSAVGALLIMLAMLGLGMFGYGLYSVLNPNPKRGGKSRPDAPAASHG
jgi:hypothetical protein